MYVFLTDSLSYHCLVFNFRRNTATSRHANDTDSLSPNERSTNLIKVELRDTLTDSHTPPFVMYAD